jgi:peroxiredoxin
VDEVVCLSVNDPFVMSEWQKDQNAPNVRFLPDGNGEFTRGMGMLVDKSDLGFGPRSWRYSMLVKDGVVQKMFIEPQKKATRSRCRTRTRCSSTSPRAIAHRSRR